eukprot:10430198-Alexandrium_andersonii.AAC.1
MAPLAIAPLEAHREEFHVDAAAGIVPHLRVEDAGARRGRPGALLPALRVNGSVAPGAWASRTSASFGECCLRRKH